jgi:hypothetical protein
VNYAVLGSLLAALLCAVSSATQARTINAASPSLTDVRRAIACAAHGDTIIVPAGTAAWTSGLTITKAITIQGNTTTDIPNGTANDQTILIDNLVRTAGQGYFNLTVTTGTLVRITGITFTGQNGLQTITSSSAIEVHSSSTPLRIDHCHFEYLEHNQIIGIYTTNFGVADHNVFDHFVDNVFSFHIEMGDYNGHQYGDGAYAEAAGFGGPKFFFIEDNYIYCTSFYGAAQGGVDAFGGGKYVYRHNRIWNTTTLGHSTGSSSPRGRGVRAVEVYNNEMHFPNVTAYNIGGTTGGSMLVHDNTIGGAHMQGWHLGVYRAFWSYGQPFYGADGNSPWDYNATEADGTHVDGHPPYLFESGTLTSASYPNLSDSTKHWTSNHWVSYAVTRPSDKAMGLIASNTNQMLTIGSWQAVHFATGNQYKIHKVLRVLDQPGTGRGDLISGDPPINTVTGTAAWPRPDNEPCYSWNNIYSPGGVHLNFAGASTILVGRDYFNDTPMPGYTPYVYPHPLTKGLPPPGQMTRNATGNSQHNLRTKRQPWGGKKLDSKKAKKAKESSTNEMADGQDNLGK